MNVKELAQKINKSPDDIKRMLSEMNVQVRSVTSVIESHVAAEIIKKYTAIPQKQKVLRVIKKADLAQVKSEPTAEGTEITAGQKAIQVIAQENLKKKEPPKVEIVETHLKKEELTTDQKSKDKQLLQEGVIRSAEVTITKKDDVPKNPLKEDTHKKIEKDKEKVFLHEKTFYKDRDESLLNILKQKPKKSRSKYKKDKLREEEAEQEVVVEEVAGPAEIVMTEDTISVADFAVKAKKTSMEIIGALLKNGIMLTINQQIDLALASRIGELIGIPVRADFSAKEESKIKYDVTLMESSEVADTTENLKVRPPIVTIMGHVDHGKTKLLDTIRSTRVMEGEAGGITQHIGAYQITHKDRKITFLDTPGHEAFTALRARGAQVTDIVILVVAANDGMMPQTIEALDHAKAAGVPIIVAINKVDLPEANIERVKQQLTQHELVPEEWGGKTVCCEVSAKKNIGIENLLEMVLITADMEDLKANPDKKAQGIIIESKLSKERGPVATVLIKAGTLRKGEPYVIGSTYGRVRAMFNDLGKEVAEAGPSYPVEILGITEVPRAGEIFQVVDSEKEARTIAEKRADEQKDLVLAKKQKMTLQSLSKTIHDKEKKALNIVLKADVQGSLEALTSSIAKIHNDEVSVTIVHSGTGIVNASDVMLAKASEAVILSFSVGSQSEAEQLAANEAVEIRAYDIIYKLLEDLELAVAGMLEPEFEEIQVGKLEVRATFKSSKAGAIAGAFVSEGSAKRSADKVKLFRNNKMIYEGKFDTLKRFKDDVKEVQLNMECGFTLDRFNDYQQGDVLLVYESREKPRVKKNVAGN
jgi:translation initiation factor IF-2